MKGIIRRPSFAPGRLSTRSSPLPTAAPLPSGAMGPHIRAVNPQFTGPFAGSKPGFGLAWEPAAHSVHFGFPRMVCRMPTHQRPVANGRVLSFFAFFRRRKLHVARIWRAAGRLLRAPSPAGLAFLALAGRPNASYVVPAARKKLRAGGGESAAAPGNRISSGVPPVSHRTAHSVSSPALTYLRIYFFSVTLNERLRMPIPRSTWAHGNFPGSVFCSDPPPWCVGRAGGGRRCPPVWWTLECRPNFANAGWFRPSRVRIPALSRDP